jgi:hypothetical protein
MITASLLQTLDRFKNIPILVGFRPQPSGPPKRVTVKVHAQYFNNKYSASYEGIRNQNEAFRKIKKRLKDDGVMSVLSGEKKPLLAGRAVEVGKASPEDIKAFVEAAIAEGIMEKYARSARAGHKLKGGQKLVDLPDQDLEELIQGWMKETGVGLDCNGFVQQALIQAREDERAMTSLVNSITGAFGLPELPMREEIDHKIKAVGSFKTKEIVKTPTELRPGDAWVVHGEGHLRIVTDVREVMLPNGKMTIQFDTAESTVYSKLDPGPVAHTWQTGSLTSFKSIKEINNKAKPRGGTFHHVLSSDKLATNKSK